MPFIFTTLLLVQCLISWSMGYDLSLLEVGISETELAVNTMIEQRHVCRYPPSLILVEYRPMNQHITIRKNELAYP